MTTIWNISTVLKCLAIACFVINIFLVYYVLTLADVQLEKAELNRFSAMQISAYSLRNGLLRSSLVLQFHGPTKKLRDISVLLLDSNHEILCLDETSSEVDFYSGNRKLASRPITRMLYGHSRTCDLYGFSIDGFEDNGSVRVAASLLARDSSARSELSVLSGATTRTKDSEVSQIIDGELLRKAPWAIVGFSIMTFGLWVFAFCVRKSRNPALDLGSERRDGLICTHRKQKKTSELRAQPKSPATQNQQHTEQNSSKI
jgi:hypothetical protein